MQDAISILERALTQADTMPDGTQRAEWLAYGILDTLKALRNPWRPIEEAPVDERILIRFRDGHIEDAVIFEDENGVRGYALFDGDRMDAFPDVFMPLPPPPETP